MKTYREGKFLLKDSTKSKRRLDFAYVGEIIDEVQFQDELQSEWGLCCACTKRNDFLYCDGRQQYGVPAHLLTEMR